MLLNKLFLRLEIPMLVLLLILGFSVRLYRFDNPIADWHSWRQADTSAVSRNFVKNGFDILHPKFDDLSNVASGFDNPQGYRFVEFPIYNVFQAGLFESFHKLTLEEWGRVVSIFASIFSSLFLYLLIKKRFGKLEAFLTSFFFLLLPFNIYYSRVILPDPSMVMTILGGTYFFDKWIEKDKFSIFNLYFILVLIFTAAAFLLKPYALFFTLPMIFLAYEKFGFSFLKKWQFFVFLILSVIPLFLWRTWMQHYPQGIPVSDWLFNKGNIRFKGAFFYWIFGDRIGRLILGFWGTSLLILGVLRNFKKNDFLFILSFIISSLLYVTVLAAGNVQHDYYQILIIPTIAILLGVGGATLLQKTEGYRKYVNYSLFLICTLFTFFFGWYFVRDYFNINNPSIIAAGNAVDMLTPKNAKVIANYNGDTSFLYQTKRSGWASFEKGLPEMIQMGADYLVLANPTSVDLNLGKTYKIVSQSNQYVIFNLNQKP
jgi:hypothetical protein